MRISGGGFAFQARNHLIGIEAEMFAVAAQEADGVRHARQIVKAPFFKRFKINQANAKRCGDVFQLVSRDHAGARQGSAKARYFGGPGTADLAQGRKSAQLWFERFSLSSLYHSAASSFQPIFG